MALGDSEYNRLELDSLGFKNTGVLPVVSDFTHLEVESNPFVAKCFDDDWTNILFVGRIIPNKRIDDLIHCFNAYKRINPQSPLLIVGSYSGFEYYLATLHYLVATTGVSDVHFIGQVSNEELTSYYDIGDLYFCASEHEGFCVPLMEGFYKRIPVVAYAAAAVPATMAGAGVLYESKDPRHVAALIDTVLSNPALETEIVRNQDVVFDRLHAEDFDAMLLRTVEQLSLIHI